MADDSPRPREARAIAALISQPTATAAAAAAGVGDRTLRRWMARPDFSRRLRTAQNEVLDQAFGTLRVATVEAVAALREIVGDQAGAKSARVAAARVVLDGARRAFQMEELEQRLQALERVVRERSPVGIP